MMGGQGGMLGKPGWLRGISHGCAATLTPVSPEAGKGHLQAPGSKPPNGKALHPVFHLFRTADAPAVCGCPSESEHLSLAPFPAVLHDLPAAPVSLAGKGNVNLLCLPLPLPRCRLKPIPA